MSRLVTALIVTLPLGGCLQLASTARTTVADIVSPRPPGPGALAYTPACPGLVVDGRCEATSLQDIHPASSLTVKKVTASERCPPTVLGVPGWCTKF